MSAAPIKPCPFCGELPEMFDGDDGFLHKSEHCFIGTLYVETCEIDDWNRRAAAMPPELAERLREAAEWESCSDYERWELVRDILAWAEGRS